MVNVNNLFDTLDNEASNIQLDVNGKIPVWLTGSFIRNGPAKFEFGNEKVNHWFDGMAMLHSLTINHGKIHYTNKFIQSNAYNDGMQQNKICFEEFATQPDIKRFAKLRRIFNPKLTDNTNVNITLISDKHIALTETCHYHEFDADTLNSRGAFIFDDHIPGMLTCAHPHYDFNRNEFYNYTIKIGPRSAYYIYTLKAHSTSRTLLAKISVKNPSYMHSFAMTENYIILIESPLLLSAWELLFNRKPFIENYHWRPEVGTRFTVIEKNSGTIIFQEYTEAFFAFHQINAYEYQNEIILDMPTYINNDIIHHFYFKNLFHTEIPKPSIYRYRINLKNKIIQKDLLSDIHLELPRIDYRRSNMRDYHYVYAAALLDNANFFNALTKLNVQTGKYTHWRRPDCIPSEPIFIAAPNSAQEDDGVVLSVVSDTKNNTSFLLILNASDFEEVATARLPHNIPYGLHGDFYFTR